jgi:hypothetical protein
MIFIGSILAAVATILFTLMAFYLALQGLENREE